MSFIEAILAAHHRGHGARSGQAKKGGSTETPASSAQLSSREDVDAWVASNAAREDHARQSQAEEPPTAHAVDAARAARERVLVEVAALPALPGVYRYFDIVAHGALRRQGAQPEEAASRATSRRITAARASAT